jgi:hypothetical protein
VARAEGNTTYRLVRHVTDDGREEVIVSGRRAVATEAEAPSTATGSGESGGDPALAPSLALEAQSSSGSS